MLGRWNLDEGQLNTFDRGGTLKVALDTGERRRDTCRVSQVRDTGCTGNNLKQQLELLRVDLSSNHRGYPGHVSIRTCEAGDEAFFNGIIGKEDYRYTLLRPLNGSLCFARDGARLGHDDLCTLGNHFVDEGASSCEVSPRLGLEHCDVYPVNEALFAETFVELSAPRL